MHPKFAKRGTVLISDSDYDRISDPVVSNVECINELISDIMSSSYTYMKVDNLTYNNLIELATELARTVCSHKVNLNTVYSKFKKMIEKFRKVEIFEVNYTNLNDLPTRDESRVVNQSPIPLPSICQPIKNSTLVQRKQSWVEFNHKKAQRIKITQVKSANILISTSEKY